MGRTASQGSSNSATDQVASFVVDNGSNSITQTAPAVLEGSNVTYTTKITAGNCDGIINHFITDTLPTSVTYVSGGTYNAGNRTITFGPVNLSTGQTQTYPFTVTVNNGTYFVPVQQINEPVAGAAIPATWTAVPNTGNAWGVSSVQAHTAPNSFFAPDPVVVSDMTLSTTSSYALASTASAYTTLSFWHRFNTEDGWDGGVVEISTNSGGSWNDLGSKMIVGKYNGSLGTGSNLATRQAFTGSIPAFMQTVIDLHSYAGQSIMIRFRFASDNNTAPVGGGWFVDDIVLNTEPAVYIKSNLYNASNQLQSYSDTVTRILPFAGCVQSSVTTHPSNTTVCTGSTASFTVIAGGTSPFIYQWQVSSGGGPFNDIAGANAATYSFTAAIGQNGNQYRCVVKNCNATPATSNAATLTVNDPPSITSQPNNASVCSGGSTTLCVTATGTGVTYQWEVSTTGCAGAFANIPAANSNCLTVTPVSTAAYRCKVTACATTITSNCVTVTVNNPPQISTQPANVAVCSGTNTGFTVAATGNISSYQWQVSVAGGGFNNIINDGVHSGATTNNLVITGAPASLNGNVYRVVVNGTAPCGSVTSNTATLTVRLSPVITLSSAPALTSILPGQTVTLSANPVTSGGAVTMTWYMNGNAFNNAGNNYVVNIEKTGAYQVKIQESWPGPLVCSAESNIVTIVAAVSNKLFIFPSPNDGHFTVAYYNNGGASTSRTVTVYDSKGSRVYTGKFQISGPYTLLPIDVSPAQTGIYYVVVGDANGSKLAEGKVIVH